MNAVGTVEGASRPRRVLLGVAAGLVVGGTVLALAIAGTRAVLTALGAAPSPVLFAVGAVALVAVEWLGLAPRLAMNWRVPAAWVTPPTGRAGAVWGLTLGAAFVTEAPFLALHVAVIAAVTLPPDALVWQVPAAYVCARFAALATRPFRRAVVSGMLTRGSAMAPADLPVTILVGRAVNRLVLLVVTVVAVWVVVA